jgi:hypothetical protein
VFIRPALPPPPPAPAPGARSAFAAFASPSAASSAALYDVVLYCPETAIQKVQLGVILPEGATTENVNFGLGCTPTSCQAALGNGLGDDVDENASFALGPGLATAGARSDTVYFSLQANATQVLCPSDDPEPLVEVRVAQFQISNPVADTPTPSLTIDGLSAVSLLEPLKNAAGDVLEPAEYSLVSVNQDPAVALTLAPATGDTSGRKWQVELDTNLELHRVTFGVMASAGTLMSDMKFSGCATTSGPEPTRRSCQANPALGPYVNPSTAYPPNPETSYTVGPGEATSGLRSDTLYVSLFGARPSSAAQEALNVAGQPVVLGVVEFTTSTIPPPPTLTLQGVGTTLVFDRAYVDTSDAAVSTPLVQTGSAYNAPSDYDADGRSDDLDNCPYTANANQLNGGGFRTTTPDLYGDLCQCADGDGNGSVYPEDTVALREALTGTATAGVVSRCSVAGGPECDVRDYAIFKRAVLGWPGPGISSVCASAVQGSQLPTAP